MRMWQPYLFIVAIFYARDVAILLVVIYIILYIWMFVKFLHKDSNSAFKTMHGDPSPL